MPFRYESLESRRLFAVLGINFQPASSLTYPNYLVDSGAVYGLKPNGQTYGWNVANPNTRDRNNSLSPDQRYDTLNHMQIDSTPRFWEIAIPNGEYDVVIVAGDPSATNSVYKISAENALVVNGTPTNANRWVTGSARVAVTDGRLTLTNAAGAVNNKIAFLQIITPDDPPVTGVPTKINFQPSNAPIPAGYLADTGAIFGSRTGDQSFGWNVINSSATRDRNSSFSADQVHDTLTHLQLDSTAKFWEIAVPNGTYSVKLIAGDPSATNSTYKFNLEGTLALSGSPTSSNRWIESTSTVTVTDGRLTLTNAAGAVNNKLNAIEITPMGANESLDQRIANALAFANTQLRASIAELGSTSNYASHTKSDGSWFIQPATHWAAGMWPGSFWRMFELTGDAYWKNQALAFSPALQSQPIKSEDITFRFGLPFIPAYEQGNTSLHNSTLLSAVNGKMQQWNETVGAFRTTWRASSSGNPAANFGVLLDNIADAELVYYVAKETGDSSLANRMSRHVQTIIDHFIRPDGSTMQWGYFNKDTGAFVSAETYQGYSSSSAWSRGQAWAMLGLTISARETGLTQFSAAAKKVSDYFLQHLPADSIPFWDFNAPNVPNTYRDTSAAAIAASALFQLSDFLTSPSDKQRYRAAGESILKSLLSPAYLAQGTNLHSLLQHVASAVPSTTFQPNPDSGAIFGDYFLLEAIRNYKTLSA